MKAGMVAVVAVDDAVEHAGRVARAFLRQLRAALEQDRGPAALRQGASAAAQPASPPPTIATGSRSPPVGRRGLDREPLARTRPRRESGREAGDRDLALAAAAGRALDLEAGRRQAVAHRPRHRPGGGGRAGRGHARHRLEQARLPHLRIARRGEAVEEEGVDAGDQLREPVADIAEGEQQLHPPRLEAQPMQVAGERRPGRDELDGERRAGLVARLASQVVARQRPGLDRDEVQPRRACRIVAPGLPGRQEVVAEAEAGLEHDELLAAPPARRQRVAGEEDLAGLGQGALARVVEVAELGRARQPVGIALEPAGDDRPGLHAAAGSASMRRRSASSRRSRTGVRPR